VLQVLALVQRRGPELGAEGLELGRLAAEQESRLRALVQRGAEPDLDRAGDRDLGAMLAGLGSTTVHVAVPGRVVVPARTAHELLDAVDACLSNVRHHVGRDAPAWVLLEDLGDRLVVSVRDEGPGIAPGRLEDAAGQGRLGVRQSIVGRIRDLGGDAVVHSTPGRGTEWELTVPRTRAGATR
jgi:signal transduction histidine kinase